MGGNRRQRASKQELEEAAWALSREGRHVEACAFFERRAALSPENPMIWNDLGNEYAAAGQFQKAMLTLTRAHALAPEYPLPLYNLGKHALDRCQALRAEGAAKIEIDSLLVDAINWLNASLDRDPENADCHRNIAIAYGLIQDAESAGEHMMEAVRLNRTGATAS